MLVGHSACSEQGRRCSPALSWEGRGAVPLWLRVKGTVEVRRDGASVQRRPAATLWTCTPSVQGNHLDPRVSGEGGKLPGSARPLNGGAPSASVRPRRWPCRRCDLINHKVGGLVLLLWCAAYERAFAHAIGPRVEQGTEVCAALFRRAREVDTTSLAARAYMRCSAVPG
jgi:hypothetical protein